MKSEETPAAKHRFWDSVKTDLLRSAFLIPTALLIAGVLSRRLLLIAAAAALYALLVWLFLRGDRCPHCKKLIAGKKGDRCPFCDGELPPK